MPSIVLGHSGSLTIRLDLDLLLQQRLLIQGNSGAGKSHLLRRLAEELFRYVQVILIDPEGEFSSLREQYDYVLVGKGGETPADTRSAALVARRLLELRASAVCDIYEMKPQQRHQWVRLFLEALVNAPKDLWHPVVIIVDEAHVFMPEKGQGESEASSAMIDLATRGRKRGFALVAATQRLSKLSKNGTAELLNRLIGQTFEDLDLDRAADALSIPRSERDTFRKEMKLVERGNFYALGRAICTERTLVHIGPVKTSMPQAGKAVSVQPPQPSKVKALLPKLADLPKEAEDELRTEAQLRHEIRRLTKELAFSEEMAKKNAPRVECREIKVPVVDEGLVERIEQSVATMGDTLRKTQETLESLRHVESELRKDVGSAHGFRGLRDSAKITNFGGNEFMVPSGRTLSPALAEKAKIVLTPHEGVTKPQQKMLNAIAFWEAIGVQPSLEQVAIVCGVTVSGSFKNYRSTLKTLGLVEYPQDGLLTLTDEGRKAATPTEIRGVEHLHSMALAIVTAPQAKMLEHLLRIYPQAVSLEDLATACEVTVSGSFKNYRSRLKTLGFVEYPRDGFVKAADLLFPKGL